MADWRSDLGAALAGVAAVVRTDVPLREQTTFQIGGPAQMLVKVEDDEALAKCLVYCSQRGIDWWVLGRGSNVVVSDQGLDGAVIKLGPGLAGISVEGEVIAAGAGALLDAIAEASVQAGLSGAEFLAGIPGTLGGGLQTNAGAFGRKLTDVLDRIVAVDEFGRLKELGREQFRTGYRQAVMPTGLVAVRAKMRLARAEPEPLDKVRSRRKDKQPQEPSAGSFFKNPTGEAAGRLIESCGLKGSSVGGARVSEKHANFIVNTGSARFSDVYELAQKVKADVEEKTGVLLEEEVQVLP